MSQESFKLKPNKSTFIGTRIVRSGFVLGAVAVAGLVAPMVGGPSEALIATGVAGLLFAVSCVAALVAYRKEHYEFGERTIRCERGSLFSGQITDLEVRNITHVKLHLPWLRWRFFGVGNLRIESAGSANSEVTLRLIKDPEDARDRVRALMKENGFSLQRKELLHEESPAPTGVALDCLTMGLSALFAVGLVAGEILADTAGNVADVGDIPWWVLAIALVFAGFGVIRLVLHWFDLSRRTYRVFADCVEYEEGFLTRTNCFLPGENIADSSTNRNFIDVLLGLYSVSVSCQGSGSEIRFRRLKRGEELSKTIDRLVEQLAGARPGREAPQPLPQEGRDFVGQASAGAPDAGVSESAVSTPREDAWEAELRMDPRRALVPLLLFFPIVPVWALISISTFVRVQTTRFSVRANSVRWSFKFLAVRQREFSYEKVTGVVLIRNPWDRLFDTVTVRLWSIGSGQPMDLSYVRRSELNLDALLKQAGIPRSACRTAVANKFSFSSWVLGRLGLLTTAGLVAVVLLVLALAIHSAFVLGLLPLAVLLLFGFVLDHLWCQRQSLRLHDRHLEAETGILVIRKTFIAFDDIKKVALIRFPGCDVGRVRFFAAGESLGAQGAQTGPGTQGAGVSLGSGTYGVTLRFVDAISPKTTALDALIQPSRGEGEEQVGGKVLRASQPALANSLVMLLFGSVVLFPLLALLPLTLPWTVLSVRRRHYRIEVGRVVSESGVIYRRHESVLWSRIDTLRRNKGPLNTVLGNGSVTLLTAGSSRPDLVLSALPDYEAFYTELLGHYSTTRQPTQGS